MCQNPNDLFVIKYCTRAEHQRVTTPTQSAKIWPYRYCVGVYRAIWRISLDSEEVFQNFTIVWQLLSQSLNSVLHQFEILVNNFPKDFPPFWSFTTSSYWCPSIFSIASLKKFRYIFQPTQESPKNSLLAYLKS